MVCGRARRSVGKLLIRFFESEGGGEGGEWREREGEGEGEGRRRKKKRKREEEGEREGVSIVSSVLWGESCLLSVWFCSVSVLYNSIHVCISWPIDRPC